jgi:hypothetical protein
LQIGAGDIERDIGAVEGSSENGQIIGKDVFAVVRDEYAVAKELNRTFLGIESLMDFGEVENAFEVKWVIDVEMHPENRIWIEREKMAMEFEIIIFGAFGGTF